MQQNNFRFKDENCPSHGFLLLESSRTSNPFSILTFSSSHYKKTSCENVCVCVSACVYVCWCVSMGECVCVFVEREIESWEMCAMQQNQIFRSSAMSKNRVPQCFAATDFYLKGKYLFPTQRNDFEERLNAAGDDSCDWTAPFTNINGIVDWKAVSW